MDEKRILVLVWFFLFSVIALLLPILLRPPCGSLITNNCCSVCPVGSIPVCGVGGSIINSLPIITNITTSEIMGSTIIISNGNTITTKGELRFEEINGTNFVGFSAPDTVTTSVVWQLPPSDGLSGQVLTTDGSGNLLWTSNGTPLALCTDFGGLTVGTGIGTTCLLPGAPNDVLTIVGGTPTWNPLTPVTSYEPLVGVGSIGDPIRITDSVAGNCSTILAWDPNGTSFPPGNPANAIWKLRENPSPYQTTVGNVGTGDAMFGTVQSVLSVINPCCFIRITGNVSEAGLVIPPSCSNVILYIDPGVTWTMQSTTTIPTNTTVKILGSGVTSTLATTGANTRFDLPNANSQLSISNVAVVPGIGGARIADLSNASSSIEMSNSWANIPNASNCMFNATAGTLWISDIQILGGGALCSDIITSSAFTQVHGVVITASFVSPPASILGGALPTPPYKVWSFTDTNSELFDVMYQGASVRPIYACNGYMKNLRASIPANVPILEINAPSFRLENSDISSVYSSSPGNYFDNSIGGTPSALSVVGPYQIDNIVWSRSIQFLNTADNIVSNVRFGDRVTTFNNTRCMYTGIRSLSNVLFTGSTCNVNGWITQGTFSSVNSQNSTFSDITATSITPHFFNTYSNIRLTGGAVGLGSNNYTMSGLITASTLTIASFGASFTNIHCEGCIVTGDLNRITNLSQDMTTSPGSKVLQVDGNGNMISNVGKATTNTGWGFRLVVNGNMNCLSDITISGSGPSSDNGSFNQNIDLLGEGNKYNNITIGTFNQPYGNSQIVGLNVQSHPVCTFGGTNCEYANITYFPVSEIPVTITPGVGLPFQITRYTRCRITASFSMFHNCIWLFDQDLHGITTNAIPTTRGIPVPPDPLSTPPYFDPLDPDTWTTNVVVSGQHNSFTQCRVGRNAVAFQTPATPVAPVGYIQNNAPLVTYQQGTFTMGSIASGNASDFISMLNKTAVAFLFNAGSNADENTQNHTYVGSGDLFTTTATAGANAVPVNANQFLQIRLNNTPYRIALFNP